MPFDVFSAIGAMVRAEATRTTEPAPCAPSDQPDRSDRSVPSDEGATAHAVEPQTAPHPLHEPTAETVPQSGALPPAAPLLPGLSA
ncbi:hypothetical protein OG196_02215 [Kitasatospora purpeofusca]|uniref:hypothetical protein n=1 Tax=Kitasatospora purpeofusca TaxID=67352 RepID=UPI002E1580FD|nr:hypothetical protein OG715_01650 [Kitasatospora purpeofusca]WSR37985.1 hypothetical protein OG196_02215 [Kitasatospora purpeofusca]